MLDYDGFICNSGLGRQEAPPLAINTAPTEALLFA
jgi:hypothetical protein